MPDTLLSSEDATVNKRVQAAPQNCGRSEHETNRSKYLFTIQATQKSGCPRNTDWGTSNKWVNVWEERQGRAFRGNDISLGLMEDKELFSEDEVEWAWEWGE